MNKFISFIAVGLSIGSIGTAFAMTQLFSDLPADIWYADSVESLVDKEIVEGYSDGTFRPSNNVNRAELAVIIDQTLQHIDLNYKNKGLLTMEAAHMIANADPKCLEEEIHAIDDIVLEFSSSDDGFQWEWIADSYVCEIDAETGSITRSYFMEY
ncbi:S-layer homology domain-containing protein [Candidatus Gracilibacteria bacterium]|nr:S-layer homology domain-containing protein [Candidatus Gracilibacteria bacterium]